MAWTMEHVTFKAVFCSSHLQTQACMTVVSVVTFNFVDCVSPLAFWVKRNLSNGQFMIQGQFLIHFHSSLINNFKYIKKVRNFQVRELS